MSMLSSQIDALREASRTYQRMGNRSASNMLKDAADTIWQLRDDLQLANASVQDAEHDGSMAWDRVRKAEAESASLRGAAQGLGELCDKYKAENAKLHKENDTLCRRIDELCMEVEKLRELAKDLYAMAYWEAPSAFEETFGDRMRELGIEDGS